MRRVPVVIIGTVLTLTAACSSNDSPSKDTTSAPAGNHSMSSVSSMPSMGGSVSSGSSAKGMTTGSAQDQAITVHTTDMLRFQPSVISARVGTVHVHLVDDGSYPHNMDVMSLHAKSADVDGGLGSKGTTLTLNLRKPGTYLFECTYHDTAGMTGKIVVGS